MGSQWISHSSINCKAPSGSSSQLQLTVTFSAVSLYRHISALKYDAPAVNGSAGIVSENSDVCIFNTSGCVSGRLVQLVHSSSGFGTSAFPLKKLSVVQGSQTRECDNTSWFSDSSIYCLFSATVSPEFRNFQVFVEPASALLPILNPFYLPAPPPMTNDTVHLRFFRNLIYPQGEDKGYRDFGTTSDFQWSNSTLDENVHHSEVMTFSFLILIRASQYFMNSKFAPIETHVFVSFSIWSEFDVTSLILCNQFPLEPFSFSVPPRLFWAKIPVSLAFCTPKALNGQSFKLIANTTIRNENAEIHLVAASPLFGAMSSGTASVTFTRHPSAQLSAAKVYNSELGFLFIYGTQLDDVCQQGGIALFKYSVVLVCDGKLLSFRSKLQGLGLGFIDSTQCLQNVTGISFISSAKNCRFNVSVLSDGIVSQTSTEFQVVPGIAEFAALVGGGPFCASAGAIVWSVNSSSEGLCLVAQLQDAERNDIDTKVNATVVARNANGQEPSYYVARSASNTSSASGLIRWCDAYSSKTQTSGVVFGARVNGNITYWASSVINVSSIGLPSNLSPINSTAVMNQTLVQGTPPPKLSFSMEDAGGNSLRGSVRVAIRVRVVPRQNATLSRSTVSKPFFSSGGLRRLMLSSDISAASCDSDLPLEFIVIQSSSSSEILAGPEFLCRAGENDIFFDVGTYSADLFSPTVSNAYTMSVTVIPGVFEYFFLINFDGNFIVQSYSLIDFLEIVFLDAGLNEVSGNVTMSLGCTNSSAFVYPVQSFSVAANASLKTYLPPFFLYVLDWIPSETPFRIGLNPINSSILQYGASIVTLYLNQSCFPGYRMTISSFTDMYSQLKSNKAALNGFAFGAHSSTCVKCPNGTISNRFDALSCRLLLNLYQ
jgi:hypothetical protein